MSRTSIRCLALALGFAMVAGLAAAQGSANFAKIVAIGDSWGMGVSNGSIVESHQRNSFPALFARQAGIPDFQQPLVSQPGISPELALLSLSPLVIAPKAGSSGAPTNLLLPRAYDNMAIAGARVCDVVNKRQSTSPSDPTDLVLRGSGATQLEAALSLRPTFVLLLIGGNDVLGAVLAGVAIEGVTLTPIATFQACYRQIVQAVAATGAKLVVGTYPLSLAAAPLTNAIKPFTTLPTGQRVYFLGQRSDGATIVLSDADYLLLQASPLLATGIGLPAALGGSGQPLPNAVVIDSGEVEAIEGRAAQVLAVIRGEAGAVGAAVAELGPFIEGIFRDPLEIGGVALSTSFLTGGFYGYDGFHPSDLGYGLIANVYLEAVDRTFGSRLGLVDLFPLMFGPDASPRSLVSAAEAAQAQWTSEAEDNLRALLNVPSRAEIEALLATLPPPGETTPKPGDFGPPLAETPEEPPAASDPQAPRARGEAGERPGL